MADVSRCVLEDAVGTEFVLQGGSEVSGAAVLLLGLTLRSTTTVGLALRRDQAARVAKLLDRFAKTGEVSE